VHRSTPHTKEWSRSALAGGGIEIVDAQPGEARRRLDAALLQDAELAPQTLGAQACKVLLEKYATWLERNDDGDSMKRARERISRLAAGPK
jgi:hypothetical protein